MLGYSEGAWFALKRGLNLPGHLQIRCGGWSGRRWGCVVGVTAGFNVSERLGQGPEVWLCPMLLDQGLELSLLGEGGNHTADIIQAMVWGIGYLISS